MTNLSTQQVHSFHIPVMGTGFTIDTPLRVAKYGISSVISLGDDLLIEEMRRFHCEQEGEPYEEISDRHEDVRASRITAYLNLIDRLVERQIHDLRLSPFEEESEITRYYEMLPETPLKRAYRDMLAITDPTEKREKQDQLRRLAIPGSIDVNIMTKADRDLYQGGEKLPPEQSLAMSGLRGYAKSTLRSSIVFSAGMNPRLYRYASQFEDFLPDENGFCKKKIILKVSGFRSALIQGRFLAKRGLWISEYRIESGLNCGGHVFATNGQLLGPILEEFKQKRAELVETLRAIYKQALAARGRSPVMVPQEVRLTAQGGIGNADEDQFLMKYYEVDGTGWGTPFLLVPEVTSLDDTHLAKMASATDKDVYLSDASPFGAPFWNLRDSASEEARRSRIAAGRPGSPCPKGYLVSNTEFTETPICIASRQYQKRKLAQLPEENLTPAQLSVVREKILAKSCICNDLRGGATVKYGIDPEATTAVCCGPGIVDFSRVTTLRLMIDHIYGRSSLPSDTDRPHMFIRELMIYLDHLRNEASLYSLKLSTHTAKSLQEFGRDLLVGIEYYRRLAKHLSREKRKRFLDDLARLRKLVDSQDV